MNKPTSPRNLTHRFMSESQHPQKFPRNSATVFFRQSEQTGKRTEKPT